MNSICIVSTQMQLLNCVELLYSLGIENREYTKLIIIVSNEKRGFQLLHLIEKYGFASLFNTITVIEPKYKQGLCNSFYIKHQIKKKTINDIAYDTVIISNYKTLFVRYAYYCIWKKNPIVKTYVVDDGMSNLEIVRRRNNELMTRKGSVEVDSKRYYIIYPYLRLKKCIAPQITFFTNHDELEIHFPDDCLKNEYLYIKKKNALQWVEPNGISVCIIGQPLPQMGIVSKKNYSNVIRSFVEKYNGGKGSVHYVPHPVEAIESSLDEDLRKELIIKHLNLPIELYALSFTSSTVIMSFYSAALYNVHRMRPDLKVYCSYPHFEEGLAAEEKRLLNEAYSSLISSGIICFNDEAFVKSNCK